MKTRFMLIFAIVTSVSILAYIDSAYAVPPLDYSQAYEYSDYVVIGKIVFVDIISEPIIGDNRSTAGVAMYEIEILKSKKNPDPESKKYPMNSEFILVPGTFLREPHPMSYDTYPYEVGQIGTFYIQKNTDDYIDSELVIRSGVSRVESEQDHFIPQAFARGTLEEYCNYSVENQLPTPWDYHCYDDPFGNPQREMNLESNAINDDYRNCGVKDTMKCFEYSQEICRPSYFHHYQNTGEGDPIYFSVFLKEDCTIHVIVDNRRDMYSSIEDRRLYQTVCPDIELRDDHIILDSCKELEPFNGSYESFRIVNEKSEPYLEPEPLYENGFMCPPGKVFDWDICVDECPFGQIPINDICMSPSNGGGAIDLDPDLSPTYAYDYANGLIYQTIIPLMELALVITILFLVPRFILKRKNIPTKPYLSLILVGLLLFFGIPYLEAPLKFIPYFINSEEIRPTNFDQLIMYSLIPVVMLSIAGILLYRSSVIRKLIKKRK